MAMRTFEPDVYEDVQASPPHPPTTKYRVAIGREYWGEQVAKVEKVQMVHNGRVSGRRAPSYPAGSDDYRRVMDVLLGLREKARAAGHRSVRQADRSERRARLRDLMGSANGVDA